MNSASLVTIDILFTYFATKAGSAVKITIAYLFEYSTHSGISF